MALTYLLGPNPKWYIADLVGRPLGGGSMYTYRSLDKTVQKFVFQDPAGNFPWTNPVLFDENGSQGPIYWQVDSLNPQETYYIEVYDSQGVLQWTQDNYLPTGGGGGGTITEAINTSNFIINNVFWRNTGSTANPIANTVTLLAPGCHAGFAATSSNAGPDILFLKNNLSATDQVTFPSFVLGTQPLTGDVTPVQYMNYTCSIAGTGETQKCVQYPITTQVQNLTNQDVNITIWARGNSGTTSLVLQWRTFYGDGAGASPDDITPIQTLSLTSSWQKFEITTTVPDVTGKTLGGCGNSALFLQVQFPFGNTCSIDHVKTSLYLGNLSPDADFILNDEIDGILNVPRTGAIRTTMSTTADPGWVLMNDGTIGNASSNATTRANIDTFPLYNVIWNATSANPTFAQLKNSAGTNIVRGATSIADFTANNQLSLTKSLGRALSNIGVPSSGGSTNHAIGDANGAQTYTLLSSNLPTAFTGTISSTNTTLTTGPIPIAVLSGGGTTPVNYTVSGGGNAFGIVQPTQYQNFQIKL